MEAYQCITGMYLIGEDLPRETNRVTLHPTEKDQFGTRIPNVHFDDHENDVAMRNHAYKRGAMVYDAMGATRIIRMSARLVNAQSWHLSPKRPTRGWRLQQMGSNSRCRKLIHFGR
jgi:hypothetical protein